MSHSPENAPRIAIVGAGVAGLAAAVEVTRRAPDARLTLFEASARAGGALRTERRDGWLIEHSADNFLTKLPDAVDFCRLLGIEHDLLPTNGDRRRALVVHDGRVVPVPEGFLLMSPQAFTPILRSSILSPLGKARLCCEPFIPRRFDDSDESVASFARRRLGKEVFERLVQPLVAGIYTADAEKLSLRATFPQFADQEREHGSLAIAARRTAINESDASESGARYSLFMAPRDGMQQIVDAAVAHLPDDALRLNTRVEGVRQADGGWELTVAGETQLFDGLIVAIPAFVAAQLLTDVDATLTARLREIEYAGISIVCLGFEEKQIASMPEGFGFVVPEREKRRIVAASFSSAKFPGRAPDDGCLVRVFIGGALHAELAEQEDETLTRIVQEELAGLIGLTGDPLWSTVARWPRCMPQYHVGHLSRVETIEARLAEFPGLELAGSAYRGVGVPQCIRSGRGAAGRVLGRLNR